MQVSYGPPALRGVTTMMAVGADELEQTATDQAVTRGTWMAAAALGLGLVTGSRTARNAGAGALAALLFVRWTSGSSGKVVPVTTPVVAAGW